MKFILNGKKVFGNELMVIENIMEDAGIELTEEELEMLINLIILDELPQRYYSEGILNMDIISKDPECLEDIVRDYWL